MTRPPRALPREQDALLAGVMARLTYIAGSEEAPVWVRETATRCHADLRPIADGDSAAAALRLLENDRFARRLLARERAAARATVGEAS